MVDSGGRQGFAPELAARLQRAGAETVLARPGDTYGFFADGFRVNPDAAGASRRLIAET